jgi:filamentous hemagglutinin family protein
MTTTIFKRRLVPLLLAASFGAAVAAPTGQQVVAGQATFSQQGNVFSITNTPGTIINWQSFSINEGEITRFIQQSSDSAVLNRIVGQDPTRILGALQSNGKVFLINPNGIMFGQGSRVDVNGLVASTLNISNADFQAGKMNFQAGANAGGVRNEGAITTPSGGQVFLIAPNVANAGIITSPQGDVVLAAGHSVQLVDSRNPDMQVVVSALGDQAINLGQVVAQGGRIGIYGALVNQRGVVNANSAVVGANGKIVLKASRETTLEQGSVTSATGAGTGGDIHLLGERVALTGNAQVNASGQLGGGTVLAGGDWQGKNAAVPNASRTVLGKDAAIRADAISNGNGGKVVLWSNDSTQAHGSISAQGGANGGNGGKIETSGHNLDIAGIKVRAGAAKGKAGDWLLDPYDIEVVNGGTTSPADASDPNKGPATGVAKIAPKTLLDTGANIQLQAQHDITVTDMLTADVDVTANAGHDININADVASGSGSLLFRAGNAVNLAEGATLKSSKVIDLIANQMNLAGNVGSPQPGTRPPVLSLNPYDASRQIQVGGTPNPGYSLWVDPAALSRFSASEINLGSSANTGGISIQSEVNLSRNFSLDTAGPVSIAAPVKLGPNGAFLATLHGDPGTLLDVNAPVTAGNFITLKGDGLRISAPVTAPTVTLAPHRAETAISLGRLGEGSFALDSGMLANVNAATLTIGGQPGRLGPLQVFDSLDLSGHPFGRLVLDGSDAEVIIDGAFAMPSGVLSLNSLSGIYQSENSNLFVDQLAAKGGQVFLGGQNRIGTVAGSSVAGPFMVRSVGALHVGTVYDQTGITSPAGASVTAGGMLSIDKDINGGESMVHLEGAGIAGSGKVKANAVAVMSTGGIGSATAPLNTETSVLMADNNLAGAQPINISNTGDLIIAGIAQRGEPGTKMGSVTVATTGNMMVPAMSTHPTLATTPGTAPGTAPTGAVNSYGGDVNLTATGSMTIDGAVTTGAGNINLTAGNGLSVGGTVTAETGNLNLVAANGSKFTTLAGASVSTANGDVNVTAGSTEVAAGTVTAPRGKVSLPVAEPPPPPPPPTLLQCIATPTLAGCGEVLDAAKTACSSNWNAGHCDEVMPQVAVCQATPSALGCATVLAREAVKQCSLDPNSASCAGVLPKFDYCKANPGELGCDAVIAQHAKVDACVANPSATCYDTVLPKPEVCAATTGIYGCEAVATRQSGIMACIASPTSANCSTAILPSLSVCQANANVYGCGATLARQKFVACSADAAGAGCDSVLPKLDVCKLTPGAEGCGAVIAKTFNFCLSSPHDARCDGILPTISQCVLNKSLDGCQAVLPTMQQCIASPTLQGCGVVLPSLQQCAANPALQGCEAVLPNPDFCGSHPQDASCRIFNPSPTGGGDAKSPVTQTVQSTVTLINGSTGKAGTSTSNSSSSSSTSSSSGSDSSSDKNSDKQSGPAGSENSGAKNEKPATKTYCN